MPRCVNTVACWVRPCRMGRLGAKGDLYDTLWYALLLYRGSDTAVGYRVVDGAMRQKISSWRWATLIGGLGLVVVALVMIAAISLRFGAWRQDNHNPNGLNGVVREYRDQRLPVRFYYPSNWESEQTIQGVNVLPAAPPADFVTQGAMFTVLRSEDDDDMPPLPPMLEAVIESSNATRASENVAVGGVSGKETIIELAVSESTLQGNSVLTAAMETVQSRRLTVVVWHGEQDDESIWVIMADARAGDYLNTLQEIRNSIAWE